MKKNYFYHLILTLSNILFPVLSFPYAARILGPEGIGKVQIASSFAQYFALFAVLGIPIYGISQIAKHRNDKAELNRNFSELLLISLVSSIVFSLVYLVVIYQVPFFSANLSLYLYAGLLIVLSFSSLDWFYSGLEAFRVLALRSLFIKLLALVLLYTTVKTSDDFEAYLLVMVLSFLGSNLLGLILLRGQVKLQIKNLDVKKHLKPILFIASTTIAASMYTILDTVILGFLTDETNVGFYTAASKLTRITLPLVTSVSIVLLPRVAQELATGNGEQTAILLKEAFHSIVFLAVPIMVGLFLLTPEFIYVFSGKSFVQAIPTMEVLSLLPLLVGVGHFFAFQVLVPNGRNKDMFVSVVSGFVLFLLLNFIFVPYWQHTGTAWASVITELVVTGLYFYFIRKRFYYEYSWSLIFKSLISTVLFVPVVWLLRSLQLNPITVLIFAIPTCVIFYGIIQYFFFKDVVIIRVIQLLVRFQHSIKSIYQRKN